MIAPTSLTNIHPYHQYHQAPPAPAAYAKRKKISSPILCSLPLLPDYYFDPISLYRVHILLYANEIQCSWPMQCRLWMRQYIGACGALVPPVHWLTCAEVNCYSWCISALMHLVHWYIGALTYGSVLTVDALVHWCIGTLLHMVHLVHCYRWCIAISALIYGTVGALVRWSIGALLHWCISTYGTVCTDGALQLVHWCMVQLVH